MNSCLYECTVMHKRLRPKVHQFTYRIFLSWIDLDELEAIAREVPIFSVNAPNLYSLRDEDHFRFASGGLKHNVIAWARAQGETRRIGSVRMLVLPRFLGYAFNPITIYELLDPTGSPLASVVEVGNTFGEYKPYLVPEADGEYHSRVAKDYYVSPFSDLDLAFDFRIESPGERLRVWIDNYRGEERELISVMHGRRVELTTAHLLDCTMRYPFITLKVIGLIHWEALRLWWKGLPFHRKEANPHLQRDVFNRIEERR